MFKVTVGGKPAEVVYSSPTILKAITELSTGTGSLEVKVGANRASAIYDFKLLPYPKPGVEVDGSPILFAGEGYGQRGDVPPTGTLNVLVVLVNPTDRVPSNPNTVRNTVVTDWNNVHTYYDQASYGRLNVNVTVTTNWHKLTGNFNDYVTLSFGNLEK